jgi:8-oxo-dGTP pyrophosphatase MutT (NUDIX family)
MLALNLVVRAVLVHEGRLLATVINDGERQPFYTFLGGHIKLGETLTEAVIREVQEEVGLAVAPSKLLYIVENFFARGTSKLHEIGYYFLCHPTEPVQGDMLEQLSPDTESMISPELIDPAEITGLNFQPDPLRSLLKRDLAEGFGNCPRLIVINELPGDVMAASGVFGL